MHSALADTTAWSAILSLVTPYLVALVNQPTWSGNVRTLVAIAVSGLVGILTCAANGTFAQPLDVLTAIAVVLAGSQAAYRQLFPAAVAAVERVTSLGARARRQRGEHEAGRTREPADAGQ